MSTARTNPNDPLLPQHRALIEASAINPEVAEQRGYRSATTIAEVRRLGFKDYQARVPALLNPIHTVHGDLWGYLLRPDNPRMRKGKSIKYESPAESRMVIDVPPAIRDQLGDPAVPLWLTEGCRKGDAAVSLGLCCIDIIGVWNWRGKNGLGGTTALADWELIALNGRVVILAFDSDAWRKPSVHAALTRLKAFLESRGARVSILYLPDAPDGGKMGLDDFIATGKTVEDLRARVRGELRPLTTAPENSVAEMLPDAPHAGLIVPDGYRLEPDTTLAISVTEEGDEVERPIAFAPILITARSRDVDDSREALHLAYRRPDGWRLDVIANRDQALDARKLTELASVGFPVGSDNARDVARYLHRFEATNYAALPTQHVTGHLGWQGRDGHLGFLWGYELLGTDSADVKFRGRDAGDEQAMSGFRSAGTLDGWVEAITPLQHHPRALLALYAAFVPPLLDILGIPNFVVDFSNRTSTGKTTVVRAAASAWGRPDERAPDGALATWDATLVGIERRAAVLSDLPLILDETQRAKDPSRLADLVYQIASGQGRTRGTPTGLAQTRTFRTVLISTGEAPISSFGQQGGTRTRVLEVRGMPFGKQNEQHRRLATALNAGIQLHYGHAGPRFVRFLLEHRDAWAAWRKDCIGSARIYAEMANVPEAGRLADFAAAIMQAAVIAHEALDLPWDFRDPLESLWQEIAGEAADASGEARALEDVFSWASSNQRRFHGRLETDGMGNERTPAAGVAGRWEPGANWQYIAFYPLLLKKVLLEAGYNPDAILHGWRENGWLDIRSDERRAFTKIVRVGGERPQMIVIRREAIEANGGAEDD